MYVRISPNTAPNPLYRPKRKVAIKTSEFILTASYMDECKKDNHPNFDAHLHTLSSHTHIQGLQRVRWKDVFSIDWMYCPVTEGGLIHCLDPSEWGQGYFKFTGGGVGRVATIGEHVELWLYRYPTWIYMLLATLRWSIDSQGVAK